jgi:LmbE family N-acetylglucosaminyl deacetylase
VQADEVSVVAVTNGENAYSNTSNLGPIRIREQEEALQILGVHASHIIRLDLPDREVSQYEAELVDLLLPLTAPRTHLIAPWTGDFHFDHEACGRAAKEVARRSGARLSFYFFWTWHRGKPDILAGLSIRRLPLEKVRRFGVTARSLAIHQANPFCRRVDSRYKCNISQ